MTVNALRFLSYTPILFLFNGYWMLSNRQIFDNVISKIDYQEDEMRSSHNWVSMKLLNHSTPMLLLVFAFLNIFILKTFCKKTLHDWGFVLKTTKIEVD